MLIVCFGRFYIGSSHDEQSILSIEFGFFVRWCRECNLCEHNNRAKLLESNGQSDKEQSQRERHIHAKQIECFGRPDIPRMISSLDIDATLSEWIGKQSIVRRLIVPCIPATLIGWSCF
jgi:hypothetical protein